MARIEERKNAKGEITSYRIVVSLGIDENSGKKLRETKSIKPKDLTERTPARIRKELEQLAIQFEQEVKEGFAFTSGDKMTFSQLVEEWDNNSLNRKVLSGRMTPTVKESYISNLKYHVIPSIGGMKLNKIKASHIDKIVTQLLSEGKRPATIRNVFGCIRSCFNYAVRKDLIRENPCTRCEALPVNQKDGKLHTFDTNQAVRFLTEALYLNYEVPIKGHTRSYSEKGEGIPFEVKDYTEHRSVSLQWRTYFTLALFSGCRRGELLALNWSDIDINNRTISIRKSLSKSNAGEYIKAPKTPSGVRMIKLPEICFELLRDWKHEQMEICFKLGTAWEGNRGKDFDDNPVFITETGRRMYLTSPTAKFKKILKAYNETVPEDKQLPLIKLHDLRHTTATLLLANGEDIKTVQYILGHKDASTTMNIYAEVLPENVQKASDKLEAIFSKAR